MITMLVSYVVVLRYMDSKIKQSEEYWKNVMFESYIKHQKISGQRQIHIIRINI